MRVRPLEALNFGILFALSVVALVFYPRLADPGDVLLRFALMGGFVALIVVLARRYDRLPTAIQVLVDFYPAAFISFVFECLGPLIAAARTHPRDDLLIAADRTIFGTDVTVWLERIVNPALTNVLYVCYATYYFLAVFLGAALWKKDREETRRYIFTLSFCYLVSYVGYFIIPALGPRFALASHQSLVLETTPLSRAIATTINQLERTKFDVFPSGHTMITTSVLIFAFRHDRKVFWVLLPVGVGLIFSTVYCRYHYAVDVFAGLALAFVSVPAGERLYDRALRILSRA